ncbi:MAG: nuclear transport factor 2 family protein [Hyphomonadaceae bacterium]
MSVPEDGKGPARKDARPEGDVEAIVRRLMTAFQRMDAKAMLDIYSDDVVIESPFHESGMTEEGAFRKYVGRAEVAKYLEGFSQFKQLHFVDEVYRPTADGRSVYIEARGDCIMADGSPYKNRYVFRFDVDGGRIVRLVEYVNPITAAPAFGRTIPPVPATTKRGN